MNELTALTVGGVEHTVSTDEMRWRPSVYGVVFDGDKVLVSPQHGIGLDLPGGGMEFGESYEDTVVREVKEETGIEVRPIRLLETHTNIFVWKPNVPDQREAMQSLLFYYLCEPVGGVLSMDGFDDGESEYVEMAKWITVDELLSGPVASSFDFRPIVKMAWELRDGN